MDLLEDLGFSLEDLQGEEEEEEETALETTDVVVAASRFQSGRSAARHANGMHAHPRAIEGVDSGDLRRSTNSVLVLVSFLTRIQV